MPNDKEIKERQTNNYFFFFFFKYQIFYILDF